MRGEEELRGEPRWTSAEATRCPVTATMGQSQQKAVQQWGALRPQVPGWECYCVHVLGSALEREHLQPRVPCELRPVEWSPRGRVLGPGSLEGRRLTPVECVAWPLCHEVGTEAQTVQMWEKTSPIPPRGWEEEGSQAVRWRTE